MLKIFELWKKIYQLFIQMTNEKNLFFLKKNPFFSVSSAKTIFYVSFLNT